MVRSRRSTPHGGLWARPAAARLVIPLIAAATCAQSHARTPAWQRPVQLAAGGAHRGPWRQNESDFRWVDDATAHVGHHGEAYVAWVDQSRKDVLFQRYAPDGKPRLPAPVDISRSPTVFSWLPRVVAARRDPNTVWVAWQEIVFSGGSHGGELFFARSSDGRTFTPAMNLSNSKEGDGKGRLSKAVWDNGSLDLAEGASGELHAAWTEYEGRLLYRRSTDRGNTFEPALHVGGTAAAPARGPSIGVGSGTTVVLAWAVGEDPGADIQLATSADAGRSFGAARSVCPGEGRSDAPKLTVDKDGTVHLVYTETALRPERRSSIRYCRKKATANQFEAPRIVGGSKGDRVEHVDAANVSVDARGRVYVLWERRRDADDRAGALAFTWSADGGERFAAPADVPGIAGADLGENGSQQGTLTRKLAVGEAGHIAVVNSTFHPQRGSHVWLLRGRLP